MKKIFVASLMFFLMLIVSGGHIYAAPSVEFTSFSLGAEHSSAMTSDHRVFMWGKNRTGQLGDGTLKDKSIPTEITSKFNLISGEYVQSLHLGWDFSSALTNLGRVFTWGTNMMGTLGDGTLINKSTPVDITDNFNLAPGETINTLDMRYSSSTAITSNGRVFTWGYNNSGQLGDGTFVSKNLPTEITDNFGLQVGEKITSITPGGFHTSAISNQGRIFIWGHHDDSVLTEMYSTAQSMPIDITSKFSFNPGESILSISNGYYHASLITSEGRVFTWGRNNSSQLGDGTNTSSFLPIDITGNFNLEVDEKISHLSIGWDNSSALTSNGRIFTWGYNGHGVLGDGTYISKNIPTEITSHFNFESGEKITNYGTGIFTFFVTTNQSKTFVWGVNDYDALGDGLSSKVLLPVLFTEKRKEDDKIAPVITLNGQDTEYVAYQGTYTETGATCTDNEDSSCAIVIGGDEVDPNTIGSYTVTYDATDKAGNQAITLQRTVIVANQYQVKYLDHDGTIIKSEAFVTGESLSTLIAPIDPNREGYTFSAWHISLPSTMPANDIEINATYTINQYELKYIDYNGNELQTNTYDFGQDLSGVTGPTIPTRVGHTFSRWDITLPLTMTANDITVTAIYDVNQYTLTYKNHNDDILQTTNFDYLADLSGVIAPNNPNRVGHTFNNWNTIVPDFMPANDIIITATYTINQYELKYADYNGDQLKKYTFNYETDLSEVLAPSIPERVGYTFNMWDMSVPIYMPGNDLTITATYSINQYELRYVDYNGDVLKTEMRNYNQDLSGVVAPNNPNRVGYKFATWDHVTPTEMPANDIIITATYTINQYVLSYVNHNNDILQSATFDYLADLSGIIAPNNPNKVGHTFNKWHATVPDHMPANDVTITATYTINQYNLQYVDYNGNQLKEYILNYETDLSGVVAPSIPGRVGHTFDKWDVNVPIHMPGNDLTITAIYTIKQYELKYVDYNGDVLRTNIYNYNQDLSNILSPNNPTRTGYTFNMWDITVSTQMPANNVIVTATYTINQYELSFIDHDGEVLKTDIYDYNQDLSAVITPNNPVREGYTFTKWDLTVPTQMPANDVKITTTYTINQYELRYVDYNGDVLRANMYDYNQDLSNVLYPNDPVREGYTFNQWNHLIPTHMPNETVTLTAQWKRSIIVSDTITGVSISGLDSVIDETQYYGKSYAIEVIIKILENEQLSDYKELYKDHLKNKGRSLIIDISIIMSSYEDANIIKNNITTSNEPLTITMNIPDDLRGNSNYRILRTHNGEITYLDVTYDEVNQTLSFNTDQFSSYAIIYESKISGLWWLLLLLLIPIGYVAYTYEIKKISDKKRIS